MENCLYRVENYMLKKGACSATNLACYYKMQEMRLVSPVFKHDLIRKYHEHLVNSEAVPANMLEKFLWFVYEQSRFERHLFQDAAETHTLGLLDLHEHMRSFPEMPKWEPYLRVVNMLRHLGHEVELHPGLPLKTTLQKIEHGYLPYLTDLYSPDEMERIRVDH